MLYLTKIHALSLKCKTNTPGNWVSDNFAWKKLELKESNNSVFGDWGIESETVLINWEEYYKADHIRAILDLFEDADDNAFRFMRCFAIDFLCSDDYNEVLFGKVVLLSGNDNCSIVDAILTDEYCETWVDWKKINLA